jgi:hypothetical protein
MRAAAAALLFLSRAVLVVDAGGETPPGQPARTPALPDHAFERGTGRGVELLRHASG